MGFSSLHNYIQKRSGILPITPASALHCVARNSSVTNRVAFHGGYTIDSFLERAPRVHAAGPCSPSNECTLQFRSCSSQRKFWASLLRPTPWTPWGSYAGLTSIPVYLMIYLHWLLLVPYSRFRGHTGGCALIFVLTNYPTYSSRIPTLPYLPRKFTKSLYTGIGFIWNVEREKACPLDSGRLGLKL